MSMLSILQEVGIDPSRIIEGDVTVLPELRTLFVNTVTPMKGNKEESVKIREEFSAKLNEAKKVEGNLESAKEISLQVWGILLDAIRENPSLLTLLIEEMNENVGLLRHEFKMSVATTDTVRPVNTSAVETYKFACQIQDLIDWSWKAMKANVDPSDEMFAPIESSDERFLSEGVFPLKDSKNDGLIPALPKNFHNPEKEDTPAVSKKSAKSAQLRFQWKPEGNDEFEEVDASMLPNDVATQVVSDKSLKVYKTWKDIANDERLAGKDLTKDSWELTFPTGTLKGYVEKSVS